MVILTIAQGIFKFGLNTLRTKDIYSRISEIENSIYHIYADISKAHFCAALASLAAADYSNNPDMEIRATIHHLYEAFFSLYNLLNKVVEKKNFLVFSHMEEYIEYKEDIYVPCSKIAVLIIDLYNFLGENNNTKKWKDYATDMCNKAYTVYSNILNFKEEEALFMSDEIYKKAIRSCIGDKLHEISETEYNRLVHIDENYAVETKIPGAALSCGRVHCQYYTFYFITKSGLEYVYNMLDAIKKIEDTYK